MTETTSTVDNETTAAAKKADRVSTKGAKTTKTKEKPTSMWAWLSAGVPNLVKIGFIRVGVAVFDIFLVTMTAVSLIPQIGAYMHGQSVGQNNFNLDGEIAVWLMPLVFVVIMIAVAEIALMRYLWRRGSKQIEKLTAPAVADLESDAKSQTVPASAPARRNKKRK